MAGDNKRLGIALDAQGTIAVLHDALALLLSASDTARVLHHAMSNFKSRGVKFVIGEATEMDAQSNTEFDWTIEVLRLMRDQIPIHMATIIELNAKNSVIQNHPGSALVQ